MNNVGEGRVLLIDLFVKSIWA